MLSHALILRLAWQVMRSVLRYRTPRGEAIDLITNGFDKLLTAEFGVFQQWLTDYDESIRCD